jgi:hypothetical protein
LGTEESKVLNIMSAPAESVPEAAPTAAPPEAEPAQAPAAGVAPAAAIEAEVISRSLPIKTTT